MIMLILGIPIYHFLSLDSIIVFDSSVVTVHYPVQLLVCGHNNYYIIIPGKTEATHYVHVLQYHGNT